MMTVIRKRIASCIVDNQAIKKDRQFLAGPCFYWLPIVDAYRTFCIAPPPEVRAVFEAIREFDSVA